MADHTLRKQMRKIASSRSLSMARAKEQMLKEEGFLQWRHRGRQKEPEQNIWESQVVEEGEEEVEKREKRKAHNTNNTCGNLRYKKRRGKI